MSSSLTSHPIPSDHMPVESVRREEPGADALYGRGGCEHIISRMESQDLSTRNKISEEMARSEPEAMEKNACNNNSKSQSEKIKDRQGMPQIRLCRNLQKGMKF